MIDLLVIAPSESLSHIAPQGFIFADQVFSEARLRDSISASQNPNIDLERTLFYIAKRFPRRIRIRWVSPWTLSGLWIVFRYRLRTFPTVIINGTIVLNGETLKLKPFQARIETLLSQPKPDPEL